MSDPEEICLCGMKLKRVGNGHYRNYRLIVQFLEGGGWKVSDTLLFKVLIVTRIYAAWNVSKQWFKKVKGGQS